MLAYPSSMELPGSQIVAATKSRGRSSARHGTASVNVTLALLRMKSHRDHKGLAVLPSPSQQTCVPKTPDLNSHPQLPTLASKQRSQGAVALNPKPCRPLKLSQPLTVPKVSHS
jgi:hypothetical protein